MRPTIDPADIQTAVLSSDQARITVLSLGCVVQSWEVAGQPMVLGYANPADYIENPVAMGMVIGRVANRISHGRLTVAGVQHDLPLNGGAHHIHGGPGGFGWRNWQMERLGDDAVRLTLHSPDGDQGYPGAVDARVTLTLTGARLRYEIEAEVDRPCPLNLAQHNYFNLMSTGDIRDHRLWVRAQRYTPNQTDLVPMGHVAPVDGTAYDFRTARMLAEADPNREGADANLVLDPGDGPCAEVTAPNGRRLRLWTDQPGLQLYTSGTLFAHGAPLPGPRHAPFAALCLEAQGYPDAWTHGFPATLYGPGNPYRQVTDIEID